MTTHPRSNHALNELAVLEDTHATGAVVFDLDGVVYLGSTPIHGASATIAVLRDLGWQILFATNNSTKTPESIVKILENRAELSVSPSTIITSGQATVSYLHGLGVDSAFVIGSQELRETIRRGQISTPRSGPVDAVVVGLERSLTQDTISRAVRAINNGATFVATNTDATFPTPSGPMPGAGATVSAVADAAQGPFVVCGKPEEPMVQLVSRKLVSDNVWMVGDRLETDIAFAKRGGWRSVLTLSGVSTADTAASHAIKPDYVIESIADLPHILTGASKSRVDEG